ncbi:hypothetical protein V493_01029 [Pseudogymnoascus sp. VKM F-4281 (FW-2241)]|nr:hypothetical protein V493_01029 [Pseudogymnoascus sp. VKM F-4281 (FW-2241)]
MDQEIAPFLLFTENDYPPDTPHLRMELALKPDLTEDSDCNLNVTIQRTRDMHEEQCIFHWNGREDGCGPLGFLLFRHTENGLRKINIDMDSHLSKPLQTPFVVDGFNYTFEVAPEGNVGFLITLPKRYRKELKTGAKYELVWPGGEIAIWDWGTINQYLGHELGIKSPKICLPAARVTLEFTEPGTPKLSVVLECEKTIPQYSKGPVRISVTYEAAPESSPIIFHTAPFGSWYGPREGFRLYRRRGDLWETVEEDDSCYMIVDEPDIAVNVVQDENFAGLQPGQTWTTSERLDGHLPDDVTAGDLFRYVFKGVEVDWWDWGGNTEHKNTTVKLPCFINGRVVEPNDNGGRQKLIVPASNSVEFTIV